MEAKPRQVFIYQDAQGKQPYSNWVLALKDNDAKAAIASRIKRLKAGNFGDCKRIGAVTELRIDIGPGYRVYVGQKGQALVILLIGGDKGSQKKDIGIAKRCWDDCEKRGEAAFRSL